MWKQRLCTAIGGCGLVLALSVPAAFAQAQAPAPDNTRVNKTERANAEPTADQAKNQKSDRDIMQAIRKSVTADKSLSTYGHNVKVISQHGAVTLEGPVRSEDERRNIEAKARDVVGNDNVTNHLTVKAENETR